MSQYTPGYGPPPIVPPGPFPPQRKRGVPWWGWALIVIGVLGLLSCGGIVALLAYIGSEGPDTKVYAGNEVPAKFVQVARDLGLLDEGETVRFFYSDALTDIREGFYFSTDKKVVIYVKSAATPATIVPYERIADTELVSGTSWMEDGTITLELVDDTVISFPVSAEGGRDKRFHESIVSAVKKRGAAATRDVSVEVEPAK
jgi:hypothetical protein